MTNELRDNIAESIRELREGQRLTQEELADRCSLSPSYISRLECKKQTISLKTLEKISDALGISSNVLLMQGTASEKGRGNAIVSEIIAILNSVGQEDAEIILEFSILIRKRFLKAKSKPEKRAPKTCKKDNL